MFWIIFLAIFALGNKQLHYKEIFMDILKKILSEYRVNFSEMENREIIAGSPERTENRYLLRSTENKLYVLEKIAPQTLENKERINRVLSFYRENAFVKVPEYLKNSQNKEITSVSNAYWQIREFIQGVDLPRPDYIYDSWRGEVLAQLLIDMRKISEEIDFIPKNRFSLPRYIESLMNAISANKPELLPKIQPYYDYLAKDFFKNYNYFPLRFCHGDFHPLNIIWSEHDVNCLIDWEFCGYKPESYDVANFLGCIGFENPEAFAADCAKSFINTLMGNDFFSKISINYLWDFVLALRFAWLSEWLRKKDFEMLELELIYWDVLKKKIFS